MVRQRSGRIISISSVAGLAGNAGQANYAAAKAGLIGFTRSVAREVASRSYHRQRGRAGYIETDMWIRRCPGGEGKRLEHGASWQTRRLARRGGERSWRFLPQIRLPTSPARSSHVDGGMVMA